MVRQQQWQFWVTSSRHWIQKLDVLDLFKFTRFIKCFHCFVTSFNKLNINIFKNEAMSNTTIKFMLNLFHVNLLVPWVLVTKVLPRLRMLNMAGALTSYQSFLEKGSTLQNEEEFIYLHNLIDNTGLVEHLLSSTQIRNALLRRPASQFRCTMSDFIRN